jgi:glycosyltransferase involved in cell wall biosynthesis
LIPTSSPTCRSRSRTDEVRRQFGFGPEDFVLGYLGRLSPEKRPQAIIEAVAGLPTQFKALLVGWGPLLSELMELANRLIPGRYAFVTASDYLGDYYQAMDAYCLLGSEEGFSLAMIEAMMCERPLIVTPVGAVPEVIVDRVNGLVVAPTADAVRTAAERLHRFPHWARGLAAEAKAFADRHGHAARMARDYEDLLERLWAERRARPVAANGVG